MENHIATGPFDGKITYTTTKDIKRIIVTDIPTKGGKNTKSPTPIKAGTVKITTYNKGAGNKCTAPEPPKELDLAASTAKIDVAEDGTATLTIDIAPKITDKDDGKLNALAHLAIPLKCKVTVDPNNLTIKSGIYALGKEKCIKTEIALKSDNIADLGLTGGTKGTVKVHPPPNHLTITYGSVTKEGAVDKTAAMKDKRMTQITEEIAQEIKATSNPNDKKYFNNPLHNSNIRYYFKLDKQLNAGNAITNAEAKIIVQYGHILAERFGNLEDAKASTHKADPGRSEKCDEDAENQPDNLVHAWLWHFFVILIVLKILLTATIVILK